MSRASTSVKSVFSHPVFIGSSCRTPIGKFGGALKHLTAPQLAALALKESIRRSQRLITPHSKTPDWVILGHARQAGAGPNPARQCAIFAGLSEDSPATTVNQACASGMTAMMMAAEKLQVQPHLKIWAGGVESMSNTPYLVPAARWGNKLGHLSFVDGMYQDGFFCPMSQMVMGETVEKFLAHELKIHREEQDHYALRSHRRAMGAMKRGLFDKEIFAVAGTGKSAGLLRDECVREEASLEGLQKLPSVFDSEKGTLSAGNSSAIADGAAFVLMSTDRAQAHNQAELLDMETVALDPKKMGLGPVAAIQNLMQRHQLQMDDLEAVEINEAFAAQVLACQHFLKIPAEKLNPRGGAIALGHPIGASGCRASVTLIHQLSEKPGALGIVSLCVSGGQGVALLLRSL